MTSTQAPNSDLTTEIVERIADHKDINAEHPDFCLYEDTDPEALERLIEGTSGPFTTTLRIDNTSVTIEKTVDGEIGVEVESVKRVCTPVTE